eukprot:TRINITY_DN14605_c0_g1_i1.p1 TRINITY_DN14605_c0_g1~~TRINITY_DN14605_c0_g1_i1.p1  ORF type:complete len:125 (+),score=12.28 TRINITY_DN14605_c0_g1_i1:33-377(+)
MGEIGDPVTYQMYGGGSGDMNIIKSYGWQKRFDKAVVWFLECIQQLGKFAVKRNKNVQLGYRINGDKIGEKKLSSRKVLQVSERKMEQKQIEIHRLNKSTKFLLAWYARAEREC